MSDPEQDWGGPYLQAAFFCERLLQESDGVISAIRIVDRVTVEVNGETQDAALPPMAINLTLFVAFKTGEARGTHDLTVVMDSPSGPLPGQRFTQTLLFEGGEDRGDTVIMPIALSVDQQGLYWFSVYLGDRLVTRIPLRVVVSRQI